MEISKLAKTVFEILVVVPNAPLLSIYKGAEGGETSPQSSSRGKGEESFRPKKLEEVTDEFLRPKTSRGPFLS